MSTNYIKISNYCAACERCKAEVVEKMKRLDIGEEEYSEIIEKLEKEGFIDEQRYAKAFTMDKFRFSHWGKRKIEFALRMKHIPESLVSNALDSIDSDEYDKVKDSVKAAKERTLKGDKNSMENRAKVLRFMASRGFAILILIVFGINSAKADWADGGTISGIAPDYVGRTLELFYTDNGITNAKVFVDSCKVDASGNFTLNTNNITRTTKCTIPLGSYAGELFIEPYKDYHVNLPPLTLPNEQDLLNPYFKPKKVLLSLINPAPDDLNLRITAFDDSFDVAFNRIINDDITPSRIEKEYFALEYTFGDDDPFFTTYRYCNYAILINLYEPTQPNTAIKAFFIDNPVAYNNPAYWDAFSVLFENYKDIDNLSGNKPLQELVVIQNALSGNVSSAFLHKIQTDENKHIAAQAKEMLEVAARGSFTSVKSIKNIDGEILELKDFESPQIYIIFANSMLPQSESDVEFAALRSVQWKEKCAVLVIFLDKDPIKAANAVAHLKNRKNILLSEDNLEFIKVFGVKNAPAYFRIDVNGKILESPAPEPQNFTL
ncbi:MAG: RecX family transcriptional regulator [Paludibacteraceae bacterium]|nr:RecX family transcriptional regulator [Paludibacteraceae bacterium]